MKLVSLISVSILGLYETKQNYANIWEDSKIVTLQIKLLSWDMFLLKLVLCDFEINDRRGENGFVNYVDLQLQGDSQFLNVASNIL